MIPSKTFFFKMIPSMDDPGCFPSDYIYCQYDPDKRNSPKILNFILYINLFMKFFEMPFLMNNDAVLSNNLCQIHYEY